MAHGTVSSVRWSHYYPKNQNENRKINSCTHTHVRTNRSRFFSFARSFVSLKREVLFFCVPFGIFVALLRCSFGLYLHKLLFHLCDLPLCNGMHCAVPVVAIMIIVVVSHDMETFANCKWFCGFLLFPALVWTFTFFYLHSPTQHTPFAFVDLCIVAFNFGLSVLVSCVLTSLALPQTPTKQHLECKRSQQTPENRTLCWVQPNICSVYVNSAHTYRISQWLHINGTLDLTVAGENWHSDCCLFGFCYFCCGWCAGPFDLCMCIVAASIVCCGSLIRAKRLCEFSSNVCVVISETKIKVSFIVVILSQINWIFQ